MGTHRYIATSFWDDEWVQTLDPSEKLLYLYLMTNPLTNIAGIYKVTVRRMSFDTGFSPDALRGIFAKFETAGKAYRMGEYIVLPSWPKHQNWESKENIKAGIEKILDSLSDGELAFVSRIGYKFPLGGVLARRGVKPVPTPVEPTAPPHEPNYSIPSHSIQSDSRNLAAPSEPPTPATFSGTVQPPDEKPPDKKTGRPPKPSLREREPVNGHERVEKAYTANRDRLFEQGGIKTRDPPPSTWPQSRKLLSRLFAAGFTAEQIAGAVDRAADDGFVLRGGYSLPVILSGGVLDRLLNAPAGPPSGCANPPPPGIAGRKSLGALLRGGGGHSEGRAPPGKTREAAHV